MSKFQTNKIIALEKNSWPVSSIKHVKKDFTPFKLISMVFFSIGFSIKKCQIGLIFFAELREISNYNKF